MLQEDQKIRQHVEDHGPKDWGVCADQLPNRTQEQCRDRFVRQLDPNIISEPWSAAEDDIIRAAHGTHDNRWAHIARLVPGR